jgi:predicted protein tyrosine phosphatase
MVGLHRPARVISLLNPDSVFPELGAEYTGRHLCLSFHDINDAIEMQIAPAPEHIREVIRFVRECTRDATVLIHCRAGVSRSTAAAYIAMCWAHPGASELEIAAALRHASPLARPNAAMIRHADIELGRQGRMTGAMERTWRDLPWIDIDENDPFSLSLDLR